MIFGIIIRCGVVDVKCVGVEVVYDGFCNLWELGIVISLIIVLYVLYFL